MKNNYWLWAVALLLVNTGWYFVSQQNASQEINRPGAEFSESRNAELSVVYGDELDYEIVHCFESINGVVYNVSINIQQGSKTLYSWEGDTNDGCITHTSSAEEGDIVVNTEIEEGVEVTTELTTWPMKNAFPIGVVLFSVGTIVVAFGETFVRYMIKKYKGEGTDNQANEIGENNSDSSNIWQDPLRPN